MINLPDAASIRAALDKQLEPQLHDLIAERFAAAGACELADMTHIVVIQPDDTETDVIEAIAFSPLDTEAPEPDWREHHPGYYELVYCVGNAGFAFLVFVQDAEGVIPELLHFCRSAIAGGR